MRQESENIIRCFLAIPIPNDVKLQISDLIQSIRPEYPGAKWVRPDSLHVTLKFLGEIPVDRVSNIKRTVAEEFSFEKFSIQFSGIGVFPSPGKARVLWAGITIGSADCSKISMNLDSILAGKGFTPEKRKFKGHLTLSRFRNPCSISAGSLNNEFTASAFEVDSVNLYRSELRPDGARYSVIEEFPSNKTPEE